MKSSNTPKPSASTARWIARTLMAVLWAAGSAYLIGHALDQIAPNWVEIAIIPILWAAVLAAPILAHHALHNREFIAAGMLTLAAIVGSAWTLSGTIARQSQGADETVAAAAETEKTRRGINQKLAEGQEILATHRAAQAVECKSGKGKRCDGVTYTVATWDAAVKGYEARLEKLPAPKAPNAGAKRIAAFVALMPGVTKTAAQLEADVELVAPCLFGLFNELAALAFGFYGFRPSHRVAAQPEAKAAEAPAPTKPSGPKGGKRTTKVEAEAQVIALRQRIPSQEQLAGRWNVHPGTVSKWMKEFETRGLIARDREGHRKTVAAAPLRIVRAA